MMWMYRITVSILFVFFLSFTHPAASGAAVKEFKDVPNNHPNYTAIQYMQENGYISGYPDSTFQPRELVTRKHVAKLLSDVLQLPKLKNQNAKYKDVPNNHPYYTPIMKLTEAGIVSGSGDQFRPDDPITRIQLAKILDLAFDFHMTKQGAFYDVYMDHWGYTHASALYSEGVASGFQDQFLPNEPVTRAHYAEFLYRSIKVIEKRPDKGSVSKEKAWDLINRLSFHIEQTMRKGQNDKQPFEAVRAGLRQYATQKFTDNELAGYYPRACVECYMNILPNLRIEPLVRFNFQQPNENTLHVQTIQFQNGISMGGFADYTFRKLDGRWMMDGLTYTPAGKKNFELTIDEAKKALEEEYKMYGHKKITAKFVTKNEDVELDPVTDELYTFEQYTFNLETDEGRFRVRINSNDGYTY